jgi:REP element-mobilizing transposase RayT
MWNDTDIPLAVFFTFRTYGTWLHGDARWSVDRFHNQHNSPYIAPNENWRRHNLQKLKCEPVILNAAQRRAVEVAIQDTCLARKWLLRALNVRTNHVHAVISIGEYSSKRALSTLKGKATRQMRESHCWDSERTPWVRKGSRRKLWNERSVEQAIEYVLYGQGDELPHFD